MDCGRLDPVSGWQKDPQNKKNEETFSFEVLDVLF
jgi:hypothetical protein